MKLAVRHHSQAKRKNYLFTDYYLFNYLFTEHTGTALHEVLVLRPSLLKTQLAQNRRRLAAPGQRRHRRDRANGARSQAEKRPGLAQSPPDPRGREGHQGRLAALVAGARTRPRPAKRQERGEERRVAGVGRADQQGAVPPSLAAAVASVRAERRGRRCGKVHRVAAGQLARRRLRHFERTFTTRSQTFTGSD